MKSEIIVSVQDSHKKEQKQNFVCYAYDTHSDSVNYLRKHDDRWHSFARFVVTHFTKHVKKVNEKLRPWTFDDCNKSFWTKEI